MLDEGYIHLPPARTRIAEIDRQIADLASQREAAVKEIAVKRNVEPAVWTVIDAIAKRVGLSASALARKAGLDATAFNKSKREHPSGKHRSPSMRSVYLACQVAGVSMAEFGAMVDQEMGG